MVKKPLRPYFWGRELGSGGVGGPAMTKACHPKPYPQLHRNDPPQSRWLRQAIPDQQGQVSILFEKNRWTPANLPANYQPTKQFERWFARIPLPTTTTNQLPISSSTNYQVLYQVFASLLFVFFEGGNVHNDWQIHRQPSSSSSGSSFQGAENQRLRPSIDEKRSKSFVSKGYRL